RLPRIRTEFNSGSGGEGTFNARSLQSRAVARIALAPPSRAAVDWSFARRDAVSVSISEKAPRTKKRRKINTGFERFSGLYLWAVFIITFGLWVPNEFLTTSTLHSVAAQQAVTGMVGLAILIPLAAGLYDLSVGATANLCGIVSIVLLNNHHYAVVPAIIVA